MAVRISPPIAEISKFATPLNTGEQRVLDRLAEVLDDEWSIFVQPHLLNMQPDFLLVSPAHGVTVIEVKDWRAGGHRAESKTLLVRDTQGQWVRSSEDPLAQAHFYRSGVRERFVSTPSHDWFGSVRAAVILPQWRSDDAKDLLHSSTSLDEKDARWIHVAGLEFLHESPESKHVLRLIYGGVTKGRGLSVEAHQRLLSRLGEPEAIIEQRQPLRLSDGARNLAENPNRATMRRVRGPAGSGKTLGLAARAAQLALDGKRVLFVSFNITLAHYAQDLVRRHARTIGADAHLIDCIHIHGFCRDVAKQCGVDIASMKITEDGDPFDSLVLAAQELYRLGHPNLPRYDAVLVDEGQDFKRLWWNFLRNEVRRDENCEMVLVADSTQDIYDQRSWVDEDSMPQCGFRGGKWASLRGCYRLPVDLIPIVSEFAVTYLEREIDAPVVPPDHSGVAAAATIRRWRNELGGTHDQIAEAVRAEVDHLLATPTLHPADIVILVNEHGLGVNVVERLDVEIEHIFSVDEDDRQKRKHRFWPGVATMKGCTVHSFKGWEARAVIVVITTSGTERQWLYRDLAYVALSRVKGDPGNRSAFVTVVNTVGDLAAFKNSFERDITISEVPQLGGQSQMDV